MTPPAYASIAVARPVRGEFTYLVPAALQGRLQPGVRVHVPFGRGTSLAFYLGPAPEPPLAVLPKLKPIAKVLDETPSVPASIVALVRFAAEHYRYPLGEALKAALPPGLTQTAGERPAKVEIIEHAVVAPGVDPASLSRSPAQAAVVGYLLAVGGKASVDELAHAIPTAKESLKKLLAKGLVSIEAEERKKGVKDGLAQGRPPDLTPEQAVAVQTLTEPLEKGGFSPWLLHGVTGSGKTEVYLRLVERALELGKGALVMVPEIALTPQLVGRFKSRFGANVAMLHSALKDRERLHAWQQLRAGEVRIAVGVRSAIFAPVPNLGLIVVDEEHDPSFKQEDKLRYQARDLAVVRGQKEGALVVLGSATPSLETLENTRKGRYGLARLTRRVDDRPMPTIELVDLRLERPRTEDTAGTEPDVLSPPLRAAMQKTLGAGQQVILFLNRRGHSTFLTCEVCGVAVKCKDCDVCMTLHLSSRSLQCHYCGARTGVPKTCPECTGPLLQLGVGTERIEAEVAAAFPTARVARLDRDAVSSNEKLTDLLAAFARRELDVLVGTQMVAKGHDFPGVTLVCVVLADGALAIPDFRAGERTFHLLTQVAGRAGRGKDPGRVLVQSYNPEAAPIAAVLKEDFDGFARQELERRVALAWPPSTRLASVRVEGPSPDLTARVAKQLGNVLARALPPASHGVRLLGPAPAPITRIKGATRWQLVLKGPSHAALKRPLDALEASLADLPSSIRVVIDVDPGAML